MQYETVILELLTRIKNLEDDVAALKRSKEDMLLRCLGNERPAQESGRGEAVSYKKTTGKMIEACYKYGRKISEGQQPQELANMSPTK